MATFLCPAQDFVERKTIKTTEACNTSWKKHGKKDDDLKPPQLQAIKRFVDRYEEAVFNWRTRNVESGLDTGKFHLKHL